MKYQLIFLTTGSSCPPPEMIHIASEVGYDSVEARIIPMGLPGERPYDISNDKDLFCKVREAINDTGVRLEGIENARIAKGVEISAYEPCLAAAAELGVKHVLSNIWIDDKDSYREKFYELCQLTAKYGLTVDLEFVTWASVSNLTEAVDLLNFVNASNARLIIDTLHFYRSRVSLEELSKVPTKYLGCFHICDAPQEIPTDEKELAYTAREERLFPGEGAIDIASIMARMPQIDVVGVEIPHLERLKLYGAKRYAEIALKKTREYIKKSGYK